MPKKKTSSEKHKYLHPEKPLNCMKSMMRKGMSNEEARKHCDSLWKKEESRRDEGRTINA